MLSRVRHLRPPRALLLALILALVHGLFYWWLVPPWQHYDEPSHFEFAAFIARHGRLPKPGEIDLDLRREIAQSMEHTGFYGQAGHSPDSVLATGERIPDIGYSQRKDPPAYYLFASLPIRFVSQILHSSVIETQLRAARLASLVLLLITVLSAWGIAYEIAPAGHPLRWALPVATALLPALVELMTAVNSDALAIAVVSLFLWGGVRFTARGGWRNAVWVIVAGASALASKNTASLALPAVFLALLLGCGRDRLRPLVWITLGLGVIVSILAIFNWGDPAQWYRNAAQDASLRCSGATECGGHTPDGSHAFRMTLTANGTVDPPALMQILSAEALAATRGKSVEIGARVWADTRGARMPVAMPSPIFYAWNVFVPVRAGTIVTATSQPTWHVFTMTVPADASYGSIELAPFLPGSADGVTVYFDNVSLTINGRNWARNGSAEDGWPWLRAPMQRLIQRVFPDLTRYNFLMVPFDLPVASTYFAFAGQFAFETFWGRFGWGQVSMPQPIFVGLRLLGLCGLLATLATWPRWRKWLSSAHAAVLALAFVASWSFTLLRGAPYLQVTPFLTTARYGFPAIVPTLTLILLGWTEAANVLASRFIIRSPRGPHIATVIVIGLGGVYAAACVAFVALYFSRAGG